MEERSRMPYVITAVVALIIGGIIGWFINELPKEEVGQIIFEYEENAELGGYTLTKVVPNGNKTIIVPNEYNGEDIVEIGQSAFSSCKEIEEVYIPACVEKIEYNAFYKCTNLREISIPNSVTTIGYNVFQECSNLTRVRIGKNVSEIGMYVFKGCTSLQEFSVHKDNERYESVDGNLYRSSSISKMEALEQYAIGKKETSFSVPNGVTELGFCAFSGSNLVNITLPDSIKYVCGFVDCQKLTSITIPESAVSIAGFDGCTNLKSIKLPNSLKNLPTFRNCSSLESIQIPESIAEIGQRTFINCTALTSITIPNRVMKIGELAFSGCDNLSSVIFKNTAYWTADCAGRDAVEFAKAELSNPETAAKYLTDTYSYYDWSQ